jgi:hypothetical protein
LLSVGGGEVNVYGEMVEGVCGAGAGAVVGESGRIVVGGGKEGEGVWRAGEVGDGEGGWGLKEEERGEVVGGGKGGTVDGDIGMGVLVGKDVCMGGLGRCDSGMGGFVWRQVGMGGLGWEGWQGIGGMAGDSSGGWVGEAARE